MPLYLEFVIILESVTNFLSSLFPGTADPLTRFLGDALANSGPVNLVVQEEVVTILPASHHRKEIWKSPRTRPSVA
jgi:hypothetical protein